MGHIIEIVSLFWILSEILMLLFLRSKMKNAKELDKNSLGLIWAVIIVSVTAGIIIMNNTQCSIIRSVLISYAGMLIIVAGMVIRFSAIRTLGKFFTVNLAIQKNHKVVKTGLYRNIRHPSYTGALMSFLGLGIAWNNWISLAIMFIPILISFMYRINLEEKLLIERIGTDYLDYKKNTRRLIPGIY